MIDFIKYIIINITHTQQGIENEILNIRQTFLRKFENFKDF